MSFTIYGNGSLPGAVHVDSFSPGWDPIESIFYDLPTFMSPLDISNWRNNDRNSLLVENSYALQSGQTMSMNYQLEIYKRLTASPWNYVGLAPQFDTITQLKTEQRTTLTSAPSNAFNQPLATIYMIPQAMLSKTLRETKMFSVISALSYVGGLFSLFLAVQTLLFGYRPSSPFGVVHRWSVGDMKRSISDGLVSRFSSLQTPVPMVNPVHRRFSKLDIKSYGNINQGPLHSGEYDPKVAEGNEVDPMEKGTTMENEPLDPIHHEDSRFARMEVMEERLQLMELLFKSYYINDEVFQSLDKALKKDRVKQRASMATFVGGTSTETMVPSTIGMACGNNSDSQDNSDTSGNDNRRITKGRRKSWLPAFRNSSTTLWDLGASSMTSPPMQSSLANPTRDFVPPHSDTVHYQQQGSEGTTFPFTQASQPDPGSPSSQYHGQRHH